MKSIEFKSFEIFLSGESECLEYSYPKIDQFIKLDEKFIFEKSQVLYEVKTIINDDVWISLKFGSNKPYSDKVININDYTTKDNNNSIEDVELKEQAFFYIHMATNTLFISNKNKLKILTLILKEKLNLDVDYRSHIKSKEELFETLRYLEKIELVCNQNMFNSNNPLYNKYMDITCSSHPKLFTISVQYDADSRFNKHFRDFIKDAEDYYNLKKLMIKGTTEHNEKIVYNLDFIIETKMVKVSEKADGFLDDVEVMNKLRQQL